MGGSVSVGLTQISANTLELPDYMSDIRGFVDPLNNANFYIFGSSYNNNCYYFDNDTQKYTKIGEIPQNQQLSNVNEHGCACFQIKKNKNNCDYYALIYNFDSIQQYFVIYDLKNQIWIDDFKDIPIYGFGRGLSMITDIFEKNIIHICGGLNSELKHGYFTFNKSVKQIPTMTHQNNTTASQYMSHEGAFYFNLFGSNNINDIKLVVISNFAEKNFVYFDEKTQQWENTDCNKWRFAYNAKITSFGLDYWVCFALLCFFDCFFFFFECEIAKISFHL